MNPYAQVGAAPVAPQEDIGAQDRLRQEIAEELLVSQVARAWPYGAVLLIAVGALGGNKPLFALGVLLAAALVVARLWARYVLRGLTAERRLSQTRAFFGEEVGLTYVFTNNKPLPVPWLNLEDEIPAALRVTTTEVKSAGKAAKHLPISLSLQWYERLTLHHRLLCAARGEHSLGSLTLESGDIFGIFRKYEVREVPHTLIVYPGSVPVERLGTPAREASAEGNSLSNSTPIPCASRVCASTPGATA